MINVMYFMFSVFLTYLSYSEGDNDWPMVAVGMVVLFIPFFIAKSLSFKFFKFLSND